jgi:hypothetical protein
MATLSACEVHGVVRPIRGNAYEIDRAEPLPSKLEDYQDFGDSIPSGDE